MSITDDLRQYFSKQRKYASFFEGPTKDTKELGVVRELLNSMQLAGEACFCSPRVAASDPPDCVAIDSAGQQVAFEATELVDRDAVRANAKSPVPLQRLWTPAQVVERVRELIQNKDAKRFKGGPYAQVIVVIHTDEPDIEYEQYAAALRQATFGSQKQVSAAFILFSYHPGMKSYPYVKLSLT